jgi:hypothetical protein
MPRTLWRPGCRDGFCDRAICRAAIRLRSHRNFSRRCSACNGAVFQSSRTNFLMLGTKHKTGLFLFRETCLRSWTSAPHADTSRPLLHRNESHRGAVEQRLAHRVKYKSRPWRQRCRANHPLFSRSGDWLSTPLYRGEGRRWQVIGRVS